MTARHWHAGRPPWWPEGEPWPPADAGRRWHRHRRRFMRRMGFVAAVFFALSGLGLATVVSWLSRGTPLGAIEPPGVLSIAIPVGLTIAMIVAAFAAIGRVGRPAADIVSAAQQVADGHFGVRIPERGPRFMRAVARAFNEMAERLAKQEQQRRELMADIAHELRTPLTVLQGRLEGMMDGLYTSDPRHVEPLLEETRVVARLTEDLRVLANAESGALTLEREPTDIGMVIRDAVSSVNDAAAAGGVTVDVEEVGELPIVDVDPLRIRQVIVNLLTNAIRHGSTEADANAIPSQPHARVTVRAEVVRDAVAIAVIDRGAGIQPDELPKIFDRFHRGAGSRGSGLGLTIARNLIHAHGGDIAAESRPGEGTTIRFTLPL